MKKLPIVILVLAQAHLAVSQNYVDIARLYYNTSALNQFEGSPTETRVTELGLDFTYPIVLKNNDALLTGIAYEMIEAKLVDNGGYKTISSIAVRLGMSKIHNEKWSGTYLLIPKLASDFEQSSGKNFQLGALALLKYTKHDQLNYKIGLYANSELFGPFTVPLFGFYYLSPSKTFEANVTLPQLVDVNYKLHKAVTVGFNFTSQIRSYRLAQLTATLQPAYVVKTANEIGGYVKFNLTKQLSFQTKVGYTLGRTYKVFDEEDKIDWAIMFVKLGDDRAQLTSNFSDGLVWQGTLLWRFFKD
jgi:Domain of unknown function (DUF6268)